MNDWGRARAPPRAAVQVGQYTPAGQSAGNRANDLNKVAHGSVKQHGVWKTLSIKTAASLVRGSERATAHKTPHASLAGSVGFPTGPATPGRPALASAAIT